MVLVFFLPVTNFLNFQVMFNFCEAQFLYLCSGDNHSLRCCVIVRIKCENGWGSILLTREPYTGRGDHSYRFAIWALADFSCPHLRDPAPNCTQSWSTRGGHLGHCSPTVGPWTGGLSYKSSISSLFTPPPGAHLGPFTEAFCAVWKISDI